MKIILSVKGELTALPESSLVPSIDSKVTYQHITGRVKDVHYDYDGQSVVVMVETYSDTK